MHTVKRTPRSAIAAVRPSACAACATRAKNTSKRKEQTMSAKKNLSEVYRYLEILVALLVTITILYVRMDSKLYDRASYIDL